MAPLINGLKKHSDEFEVIVCVTAQHREMLDQTLSFFGIKPDIDLNLMKSDQSISDLVAKYNYDGIDLPSFAPTLI